MIDYILQGFQNLFLGVVNVFTHADLFKNPVWLWLVLLLPVYLVWYFWWYDPRRLVVVISYDARKLAGRSYGLRALRYAPMVLNMFALLLMTLAMSRPVQSEEVQARYAEGIDIMLVLDVSGSMETEDFEPNRLEVAKDKAIEFIDGRKDDRIGVVVFAEDAFSYVPLTLDYALLKKQIEALNSNIMPKNGTAMGSAISVAINRFSESSSTSKVMVLITDGSSNRGQIDPITSAQLAAEREIRIYTIGVGKEEFIVPGLFGGQKVKTDLDIPTMEEISRLTGGKFFRAEDESSLGEIFNIISSMEKTLLEDESERLEKDAYLPLLFWAVGAFLLSFLIGASFLYNPLEG